MEPYEVKSVEMTRQIRDEHYQRFKDRPIEERIAYYRENARLLHDELQSSDDRAENSSAPRSDRTNEEDSQQPR